MPNLYVIGGANGAGKTTTALRLLPDFLSCYEYVNADLIATGLAPFKPESVALQAGRLMLRRIHELANAKVDFAFETTLASRSFVPFLQNCKHEGYIIRIIYLWLRSIELATERVRHRVASGGHDIPEQVIRRRYDAGRSNFVNLYLPIADGWSVYDNSSKHSTLIAKRTIKSKLVIYDLEEWRRITR